MKSLLITLAILLVSCKCDCTDNKKLLVNRYMINLPNEAVFIKAYPRGNENDNDARWIKWSLGAECFLSYRPGSGGGITTKVNCDSEVTQ